MNSLAFCALEDQNSVNSVSGLQAYGTDFHVFSNKCRAVKF